MSGQVRGQVRGHVRGWCPSLFEPMASGDGLLARVKPPVGTLSAAAARAIAAAARSFGNGQIELTNRGALQVRGLSEASLRPFQTAVREAGLASADPAVERRRNLAVSPFATRVEVAVAQALERWIGEDQALAALPPKFGFAVGTADDPRPAPGDVRLTSLPSAATEDGARAWRIGLGDGGIAGTTVAPVAAVRTLTRNFIRICAALDQRPPRMAEFVRRFGVAALFEGVDAEPADTAPAPPQSPSAIAGAFGGSFALGLPFGAANADQLDRAAELAERFADGGLRLSPWRALVLAEASEVEKLAPEAHVAGFIVDPADPRLSVSACPGAPACANARAAVRADAARLAGSPLPGHLHLSGCAKGCAHPIPAAFTLVAGDDGYGLVRRGRAGDPPQARGLTLEAALRLLAAETP
jgi:precorrin-3B synthase